MKKIYTIPEIEVVKTLLSVNILEDSGQAGPMGNENNTFEEEDEMTIDLSVSNNLWDD